MYTCPLHLLYLMLIQVPLEDVAWLLKKGKKSPYYTINIIHVPRSRTSPIITEEKHLTTGKKEGCHETAASEQKDTLRKTDISKKN